MGATTSLCCYFSCRCRYHQQGGNLISYVVDFKGAYLYLNTCVYLTIGGVCPYTCVALTFMASSEGQINVRRSSLLQLGNSNTQRNHSVEVGEPGL